MKTMNQNEIKSNKYLIFKYLYEAFKVIVGSGIFATFIMFYIQSKHDSNKAEENRKIKIYSKTLSDFSCFIDYRSRLNNMAIQEKNIPHAAKEIDGFYSIKNDYVMKRNECKINLISDFEEAKYKFNTQTTQLMQQFLDFDKGYRDKTISYLPSDAVYEDWLDKIVEDMQKQLPKEK